ncbi:MAG: hypothetical protein IMY72_12645 [Bacteroidetes bacterium]|nr:hypothetical protein [Bacteroidota bacterium]
MKKIKIGLILIMATIFFNSYAQLNNFNLSDYKLPDLERRSLETNFNLSGQNDYYKINPYGQDKTGENSYYGNIYINYKHYLNSAKLQQETNLGLNFSSNFYNRKEDKELVSKSSNINPQIYLQRNNRKYFNTNYFFETDVFLNYQYGRNYTYSKYSDGSENKENLQTHRMLAYIPLKIGLGRVEPVQDARQAIYILDELYKANRISSVKSDEKIIEFAEFISKLKNKRFFDSRLKKIAEIEAIDSFLVAKNYLKKSDARYFTTIEDFWDYGNSPMRNSGTRFSFAILPGYYIYNNNLEDKIYSSSYKYNINALLFDGGIEIKHEKPLNLYWQNSINLNAYAGLIEGNLNNKTNSIEKDIRIPNIQLGFNQSIGFYPNTRTDISFRYSFQYVQLFDKADVQNEIIGAGGKGAKAETDLLINYYISPKFRLNITSSFYYIWQDSEMTINYDNTVGSSCMLYNYTSNTNGYVDYIKRNSLANNFRISLIYSVF